MPWKEMKVFTKVPQFIWTRPLQTRPRSCPRHVSKKEKVPRETKGGLKGRGLLTLFHVVLLFLYVLNPPPSMPCHSCLAVVEQQQQLLLYSRLAKSLICTRTCIRQCQAAKSQIYKIDARRTVGWMPHKSSQKVANRMPGYTSHRIWTIFKTPCLILYEFIWMKTSKHN
jgi:hypothetical protein